MGIYKFVDLNDTRLVCLSTQWLGMQEGSNLFLVWEELLKFIHLKMHVSV